MATKKAAKKTSKAIKKAAKAPKTAKLPRPSAPKTLKLAPTRLPKSMGGGSGPKPSPRLQAMVDEHDVHRVVQLVARYLDRLDENALRAQFHPDASLDLGPGIFQGAVTDYLQWVMGIQGQTKSTHHLMANCLVDVKGDNAFAETYAMVHHRLDKPTGREDLFIAGRYLDRLERRPTGPNGLWKIIHRKLIMDWVRTEPVADIFYHYNPDGLWGQRGKGDLSYQMEQFPGSQGSGKMPSFIGRRFEGRSIRF
ncbi:MAG: nuclear transport factor 2 family protein [Alphaproteobacteria bacterium]|nr:nuclear transport factor 2 family protein [Alphaproteobacteria bacterium]